MLNKKTKILSIDPGFERLGIAILEKENGNKEKLIYSECFKTSKNENHEKRLVLIGKRIAKVIEEHNPEILAIEKIFFNNNQKTIILVSQAIGVIIYEASFRNLTVYELTPLQVKNAVTGYGRGDKKNMIKMIHNLIEIKKEIKYDDEYDAIGVGLAFFSYRKTLFNPM